MCIYAHLPPVVRLDICQEERTSAGALVHATNLFERVTLSDFLFVGVRVFSMRMLGEDS